MKLNGALKPRHGASRQGSSPGVVLRKYRDKRYNSQNENVVNGLPLNECGGLNKTLNTNYKNNNQQQQQHNPLQKKCGEISSSLCSSSYYNYNNSSNNNNTQYRITTTTTSAEGARAAAENIDYNSHGSRKSAPTKTTINHNNKDVVNLMPTQQQQPVNNNITTRQVNNNNSNSNINNKENNNGEKKAKQTNSQQKEEEEEEEAVEIRIAGVAITTTPPSNISKYHVTPNKNNNNYNNNRNNTNNTISYCKEVNKFLLIPKIYEKLISCALAFLTVIISWLFIQFKLLLFSMFSMSIEKPHLTGYPVGGRHSVGGAGGSDCGGVSFDIVGHNSNKIMRASQSFKESFERICFKNVFKSRLPPSFALCLAAAILLPLAVVADDGDNFYPINGLETTTPEFDYASRGQKKFGDKCENTLECGFPGSICDPKKKSCQCTEDLPVTNHFDKCGKEAAVNESCFFNEQCEVKYFQTECRDQRCVCRFDMSPIWLKDGTVECKGRGEKKVERYIDPAMIGVLIGMALMFIIICVVLRLFSQARWHENRTIFNTPNPRLMNVSLLRESKLLHGQERRGSRMSVRAPSRQPSMASLRPHSPNPSLGKTGSRSNSNSHGSNASATSLRSTRSNSVSPAGIVVNNTHHERKGSTYQPHHQQQHHPHTQHHSPPAQPHHHQQHHHHAKQDEENEQKQPLTQTNIISNPVAESVTVEIIEPEK